MTTEKLNELVNVDIDGKVTRFLTDATLSTIKALPEIEWYAIKNVLMNLGYVIIEINETRN